MSNNDYQDDKVSQTYKSLANEKTPAHLDQKVMEMAAARTKRPRYSRWMAWSRPLAWAATITLCLAITLELAREPALSPTADIATEAIPAGVASESAPAPAEADTRPARMEDSNTAATLSANREQEAEPGKDQDQVFEIEPQRELPEAMAESIVAEKTELRRSSVQQPASAAAPAARVRQASEESDEEKTKPVADQALAEQQSFAKMSAGVPADAAMTDTTDADECSEDEQREAQSWLECILELESAGLKEVGLQQRDALKETFPDFKLP